MAEVTHAEILDAARLAAAKVQSLEEKHQVMQAQLDRVEKTAADAERHSRTNREHFDTKLTELNVMTLETQKELGQHRAEFKGLSRGIGWGGTVLAFIITIGLTVVGWLFHQLMEALH